MLDILVSFFMLLLLSPIFILIAWRIKSDSPGPVFYRGWRLGKNGRRFKILKFRTMYERPESYAGPPVTGNGDHRITPFGRWLRDTKINELPQFWNVLKGDMSLVGPRPEDPTLAKTWPANFYHEMISVRPGLSSPASILYKEEEKLLSSNTLMDDYLRDVLPSKLRLDLLYIRQRTILNDLDIIFLTLVALVPVLRHKEIPRHLLYSGPFYNAVVRYINWFLLDWLVALLAAGFTGIVWRLSGPINVGVPIFFLVSSLIASIFSLVNALLRVNTIAWHTATAVTAIDLALSASIAVFVLFLINHLIWPKLLPDGMLILIGVLAFVGFVTIRYRERLLIGLASRWLAVRHRASLIGERVLIVGAGELGEFASWLIKRGDLARAFSIVGFVDDNPRMQGLRLNGAPVLGSTADISSLLVKHDIGVLIFAIENIAESDRQRILAACQCTHAQVVLFPDVLDQLRASFSANPPKSPSFVSRQVGQSLGELDDLLARGELELARARLAELRRTFPFQEVLD